jgi:predicted acylesterase/phospholipase RssA
MKYDMVFEGGGAKGMVFVGALQVFESLGHTPGRLLGTSAGAITAAMLAAGYSSLEMLEALAEQKEGRPVFADFMSVPAPLKKEAIQTSATRAFLRNANLPFVPDRFEEKLDDRLVEWLAAQDNLRCVFSFIEDGGWYSADNFLTWLRRRLDTGTFNGQPRRFSELTLAQFFEATQRDLSLIGADTTRAEMLVLNHKTAPDLPLVMAVRMSMSLPLLWQAVVWQADWGTYRGRTMTGDEIVDGGLLSNFPIELFVSQNVTVTNVMGPDPSENVLGMLIDESLPVPGAETVTSQASGLRVGDFRTVQRLSHLMNTTLSARDKAVIEAFEKLVVRLPAKGYGTTEFDMTVARREALVEAGRQVMKAYFDRIAQEGPVSFGTGVDEGAIKAQQVADKVAMKILDR